MGKITIKHFLNTNLKPYVINKENYYSIYLMITGQRKTTKVKSLLFDEYYSESDFENIFNSNNFGDKTLIENEINSVKIICELVTTELKEFDTNFLTAFYNFSNTIDIWKPDNQIFSFNGEKIDFYDANKNNAGIILDRLKVEFTNVRGVTLYEFYNKENQEKALKILKKQKVKNETDSLDDINKTFFYASMEFFEWFIKGNKKNAELESKFKQFFETGKDGFDHYIVNKYKTI